MEDILIKVQRDLDKRREYLREALVLEKKALDLRLKAKYNNLDLEIDFIQQRINDNIGDINDLCNLLDNICSYLGHDYVFIKEEKVYDSSGLENSFEVMYLHYCRVCGKAVYLDYKNIKDFDIDVISKLRRVKKLRKC